MDSSMRRVWRSPSVSNAVRALVLTVLVASSGCIGSGPQVVLIPAIPTEQEALITAEAVRVRVLVTLDDGTVTVSRNKLRFPAGSLIGFVTKENE